jgi:hypothetical protein
MLSFTSKEISLFKKLNTPAKVQDFINAIPINFEHDGKDTIKSPIRILRENKAHCIEGALLAAYILSLHGHKPLLMHLKATKKDQDHVVALFKVGGYWGAISKTNHAVLRYREPVYKTLRELALSYFHEYSTDDGTKTLRSYSAPLNLQTFQDDWMLLADDLWGVDEALDHVRHHEIAPSQNLKKLRRTDPIERAIGKIVEWEK